jgi:hypothetical protein
MKLPQIDPAVISDLFGLFNDFGKVPGKIHDHLGMTIDYAEDGKVKDFIDDCIRNA